MTEEHTSETRDSLKTNRLEGLTDGTFAIAMTILVFDLKVPEIAQNLIARSISRAGISNQPTTLCFISIFLDRIDRINRHANKA